MINYMAKTQFYFYNLYTKEKEGQTFNWEGILDKIYTETKNRTPHYENHSDYILSIHIAKKETLKQEQAYFGYIVVGEDEGSYQKEKHGDFYELGFEEDEYLCHVAKGKLYFVLFIDKDKKITLMLEKQYFSINIKGFLNYFKNRYSNEVYELTSKNILGKDLISTIKSLKDNKIRLARLYFRKAIPEETIRKFGYVEEAIPSLLKKGIYADLVLHWDKPIGVIDFFTSLFKTKTFDESLDVDFGEFLKIFSFETDNDTIPSLNLLDKIICFILPLDKSEYDEEDIFKLMKEYYLEKREKII
jgi:hypothetical protein